MRIVHLTPLWSATTGGPSRYVASLKRELESRGHEVHVLTTDTGAGADTIAGSFPFRDVRMFRRLRRLDPDIVHVHNSVGLLLAAFAYRGVRPGARVIFTFHTQPAVREFLPGLGPRRRDYGVVAAALARTLLRSTDLVTTVSDSIVAWHNELYGLGIRGHVCIPSGGDAREPSIAAQRTGHLPHLRGDPLLLSVGVMTWDWKVAGHLLSVRAVDKLRTLHPGVMLLIAGDGVHREVVEREVAAYGLGEHVCLLGNVRVDELLDAADIYVHMAMNEGCSLAIIEAMHAGKPIVAANAGGTPEVLLDGETALLVEPDVDALAAAIQRLIADTACRAKLAERARETALAQYTWAVVAERYEATYRALLAAERRA